MSMTNTDARKRIEAAEAKIARRVLLEAAEAARKDDNAWDDPDLWLVSYADKHYPEQEEER